MKRKILLVEDNPATVDVIQEILEFLDYDSAVAEDGQKAVDLAATSLPDLILMDIFLPKMDGLKATALIRKNPKTQNIPILAATARALPGDREICIKAGCDDYIAKPFTHRELGAAIKKLLLHVNKDLENEITEHKETEESLRNALEQLEKRFKELAESHAALKAEITERKRR